MRLQSDEELLPFSSTVFRLLCRAALILLSASTFLPAESVFGLTPSAGGPHVAPLVAGLAAEDYGQRFGTALDLLTAARPGSDAYVAEAVDAWRAAGASEAVAAGEFMLRKLRGQPVDRVEESPGAMPDVVLVSIDTLRADHLHCYGYERPTSPTLDALAAGGVLFENTISPSSWTLPVHMSIFTSLYPSFHKLDRAGRLGSIKLDETIPTLPELLKAKGYVAAGFAANGYLNPVWGFGRGFDFYREYVTDAKAQLERAALWVEWVDFHRSLGLVRSPLFLFVHLLDPHGFGRNMIFLEDGVKRTDPRYRVAMYDGQIQFVDAQLKTFLDIVDSLGTLQSTMVVITADHGEEFGDHGGSGHKNTLYEEQLRVPLIVSYPARAGKGRRVSSAVSLLDIAPTILDVAGGKPPASFQGISLASRLAPEGAPASGSRTLFAELHPTDFGAGWDFYARAARTERYKLIRTRFKNGRTKNELYDLTKDRGEKKNVYGDEKRSAPQASLEEQLDDFMHRAAAYRPEALERNRIELDRGVRERLRALGYED